MIEQRPVHVQMITKRTALIDTNRVQQLKEIFAKRGVSGCVLLLPRQSTQERYKAVAHAEIVLAAMALGIETVWALVGPWPDDLMALMPDTPDSTISSTLPSSTTALALPSAGLTVPASPEDMPPLERARFYEAQLRHYGSHRKAAKALGGIPRSRINNAIQLLKLDEQVQRALEAQQICESAARTLSLVPDHAHQIRLLDWYLREHPHPTIRELESSVRTLAASEGDPTANGMLTRRFCEEFSEQFGVRLRYVPTGMGGWCSLDVSDDEQGALLFARLLQIEQSDRYRVSARKTGAILRIRFHVESPHHLEQVLCAAQCAIKSPNNSISLPITLNNASFFSIQP